MVCRAWPHCTWVWRVNDIHDMQLHSAWFHYTVRVLTSCGYVMSIDVTDLTQVCICGQGVYICTIYMTSLRPPLEYYYTTLWRHVTCRPPPLVIVGLLSSIIDIPCTNWPCSWESYVQTRNACETMLAVCRVKRSLLWSLYRLNDMYTLYACVYANFSGFVTA